MYVEVLTESTVPPCQLLEWNNNMKEASFLHITCEAKYTTKIKPIITFCWYYIKASQLLNCTRETLWFLLQVMPSACLTN